MSKIIRLEELRMDYLALVYQIAFEKAKDSRHRKKMDKQITSLLSSRKAWATSCQGVKDAFKEVWGMKAYQVK